MAPSQPHPTSEYSEETYANVKWEELGFGFVGTEKMYVAKCRHGESFEEGKIVPFGDLQLHPCAAVLQYGQGLYEGLKAYRTEDGRILLFRPEQNGERIQEGAKRMYMPYPSVDQFVSAIKQVALANKKWDNTGLNLKVEDKFRRAFPSGTGGVKSITNYSPAFLPLTEAKKQGFSDVLFLDAATGKYVEELFAANIFICKGNVVSTPAITGTILPGVTRNCVIELSRDFGYQVEEREIPIEEFLDADEAFCTGTATIVSAVASVTFKDIKTGFKTGEGTLATKLYETLNDIQMGRVEDTKGWTVEIDRYHQG